MSGHLVRLACQRMASEVVLPVRVSNGRLEDKAGRQLSHSSSLIPSHRFGPGVLARSERNPCRWTLHRALFRCIMISGSGELCQEEEGAPDAKTYCHVLWATGQKPAVLFVHWAGLLGLCSKNWLTICLDVGCPDALLTVAVVQLILQQLAYSVTTAVPTPSWRKLPCEGPKKFSSRGLSSLLQACLDCARDADRIVHLVPDIRVCVYLSTGHGSICSFVWMDGWMQCLSLMLCT